MQTIVKDSEMCYFFETGYPTISIVVVEKVFLQSQPSLKLARIRTTARIVRDPTVAVVNKEVQHLVEMAEGPKLKLQGVLKFTLEDVPDGYINVEGDAIKGRFLYPKRRVGSRPWSLHLIACGRGGSSKTYKLVPAFESISGENENATLQLLECLTVTEINYNERMLLLEVSNKSGAMGTILLEYALDKFVSSHLVDTVGNMKDSRESFKELARLVVEIVPSLDRANSELSVALTKLITLMKERNVNASKEPPSYQAKSNLAEVLQKGKQRIRTAAGTTNKQKKKMSETLERIKEKEVAPKQLQMSKEKEEALKLLQTNRDKDLVSEPVQQRKVIRVSDGGVRQKYIKVAVHSGPRGMKSTHPVLPPILVDDQSTHQLLPRPSTPRSNKRPRHDVKDKLNLKFGPVATSAKKKPARRLRKLGSVEGKPKRQTIMLQTSDLLQEEGGTPTSNIFVENRNVVNDTEDEDNDFSTDEDNVVPEENNVVVADAAPSSFDFHSNTNSDSGSSSDSDVAKVNVVNKIEDKSSDDGSSSDASTPASSPVATSKLCNSKSRAGGPSKKKGTKYRKHPTPQTQRGKDINHEYLRKEREAAIKRFEDLYIFGRQTPMNINISQMEHAPAHLKCRPLHPEHVAIQREFLESTLQMSKRILTLMPVNQITAPTTHACQSEIMRFWIIDGQHTHEACVQMANDSNIDEEVLDYYREWPCDIVWSRDEKDVLELSRRLNTTNQLKQAVADPFLYLKHCREIWNEMGAPTSRRRCKKNTEKDPNTALWNAFIMRILHVLSEFHGRDASLAASRGEIQLITSSIDVWDKWLEVCMAHHDGRLICPTTGVPFCNIVNSEKQPFKPQKLAPNTFRSLTGLDTNGLIECATKILAGAEPNNDQTSATRSGAATGTPKIYIGKPGKWVPDMVSLLDWVQRKKEKSIIIREMMRYIDGGDVTINDEEDIDRMQWVQFKAEHRIHSPHIYDLIRRAGKAYMKQFTAASLPKSMLPMPEACIVQMARIIQRKMPHKEVPHPVVAELDSKNPQSTLKFLTVGTDRSNVLLVERPLQDVRNVCGGIIDLRAIPLFAPRGTLLPNTPWEVLFDRLSIEGIWLSLKNVRYWMLIYYTSDNIHLMTILKLHFQTHKVQRFSRYLVREGEKALSTATFKNLHSEGISIAILSSLECKEDLTWGPVVETTDERFAKPQTYRYEYSMSAIDDELRMETYMRYTRQVAKEGGSLFTILAGRKPMISAIMHGMHCISIVEKQDDRTPLFYINGTYIFGRDLEPHLFDAQIIVDENVSHNILINAGKRMPQTTRSNVVVLDRDYGLRSTSGSLQPGEEEIMNTKNQPLIRDDETFDSSARRRISLNSHTTNGAPEQRNEDENRRKKSANRGKYVNQDTDSLSLQEYDNFVKKVDKPLATIGKQQFEDTDCASEEIHGSHPKQLQSDGDLQEEWESIISKKTCLNSPSSHQNDEDVNNDGGFYTIDPLDPNVQHCTSLKLLNFESSMDTTDSENDQSDESNESDECDGDGIESKHVELDGSDGEKNKKFSPVSARLNALAIISGGIPEKRKNESSISTWQDPLGKTDWADLYEENSTMVNEIFNTSITCMREKYVCMVQQVVDSRCDNIENKNVGEEKQLRVGKEDTIAMHAAADSIGHEQQINMEVQNPPSKFTKVNNVDKHQCVEVQNLPTKSIEFTNNEGREHVVAMELADFEKDTCGTDHLSLPIDKLGMDSEPLTGAVQQHIANLEEKDDEEGVPSIIQGKKAFSMQLEGERRSKRRMDTKVNRSAMDEVGDISITSDESLPHDNEEAHNIEDGFNDITVQELSLPMRDGYNVNIEQVNPKDYVGEEGGLLEELLFGPNRTEAIEGKDAGTIKNQDGAANGEGKEVDIVTTLDDEEDLVLMENDTHSTRKRKSIITGLIREESSEKRHCSTETVKLEILAELVKTEEKMLLKTAFSNTLECAIDCDDLEESFDEQGKDPLHWQMPPPEKLYALEKHALRTQRIIQREKEHWQAKVDEQAAKLHEQEERLKEYERRQEERERLHREEMERIVAAAVQVAMARQFTKGHGSTFASASVPQTPTSTPSIVDGISIGSAPMASLTGSPSRVKQTMSEVDANKFVEEDIVLETQFPTLLGFHIEGEEDPYHKNGFCQGRIEDKSRIMLPKYEASKGVYSLERKHKYIKEVPDANSSVSGATCIDDQIYTKTVGKCLQPKPKGSNGINSMPHEIQEWRIKHTSLSWRHVVYRRVRRKFQWKALKQYCAPIYYQGKRTRSLT